MLRTANVFNRDLNSNPTHNYQSNNSSNTFPSPNQNVNPQLGSYRLQYRYEQPSSYLQSVYPPWKQILPCSIMTREQTMHMHITQLRIQDYYMIRNKLLKPLHQQKLKNSINQQCFNEQLLRCESHKLPPITHERPLDINAIRSGAINNPLSNSNQNSSNNALFTNNNNQQTNNNSRNSPLNAQTNNDISRNLFTTNSTTSNNVFLKNSNASSNNTAFGNNNTNSNNNFLNNPNSNNPNLNILSSNNSNANNANLNIFTNSSNAPINNNFLNTNNGAGLNHQNNNSSNTNLPTGGNLFANNNMLNTASNNQNSHSSNSSPLALNNNTNNNLLNNGYNNMNSNLQSPNFFHNNSQSQTLFSNNISQPQTLFPDNNCFQSNLQGFLYENRQFLQMLLGTKLAQNSTTANNKTQQPINKNLTLFNQRFTEDDLMQIDSGISNRTKSPQTIIYINRGQAPSSNKLNISRKYIKLGQSQTKNNLYEKSKEYLQESQNYAFSNEPNRITKSKIISNSSRIINNHRFSADRQRETYYRNQTLNRHTVYRDQNKRPDQSKQLHCEYQCELQLRLKVIWLDDRHNQITEPNRCTIETRLLLPHGINTNTPQSKLQIVKQLKQNYPFVRSDAQIIFTTPFSRISTTFSAEGQLQQRIINLKGRQGDEDYKIYFSNIKNNQLLNLTISNIHGTVSWDKPIPLDSLDFNEHNIETFSIDNNCITCELPSLNYPCRVTFNSLPQKYKHMYQLNPQQTKQKFQEQLQKMSKHFQLSEIWSHGDNYVWSMSVSRFQQQDNLEQ